MSKAKDYAAGAALGCGPLLFGAGLLGLVIVAFAVVGGSGVPWGWLWPSLGLLLLGRLMLKSIQ